MKILLLITILSISEPAKEAVDSTQISLEEALQYVRVNNYDVQMALADLAIAKGQLNETNSTFLPSVMVSENYSNTNDPLNVFGFRLKQGITTTDDFNPASLNSPSALDNWNTRVEVNQPLINPEFLALRSALKESYEASELQYQRQLQYAEYIVRTEYFRLSLIKQTVGSVQMSLQAAGVSLQLARDNQDAGYLLESDVIAAELRYLELENQLEEIQNKYQQLSDQFRFLIQMDGEGLLTPTSPMEVEVGAIDLPSEVPTTRKDLQALELHQSSASKQLKSSKFRMLPTLNAQAAYEWNDSQLLGTGADNYLVGASLRWKIFDGQRNLAKVQQHKGQLRKAELAYAETKEQSDLQLKKAKNQFNLSNSRVGLAERALQRAQRLYQIKRDRFEQGLEKTSDLIEAESKLTESRVNLLEAQYQRMIALNTIKFLTN